MLEKRVEFEKIGTPLEGSSPMLLAGNLSLYQELNFIQKMNHLVDKLGDPEDGRLCVPGREGKEDREYKHIGVRWIRMSRPLDFVSKLDRNPTFIRN